MTNAMVERKIRRILADHGCELLKRNYGHNSGYQILDKNKGSVVAGRAFNLSLDDVRDWAAFMSARNKSQE